MEILLLITMGSTEYMLYKLNHVSQSSPEDLTYIHGGSLDCFTWSEAEQPLNGCPHGDRDEKVSSCLPMKLEVSEQE